MVKSSGFTPSTSITKSTTSLKDFAVAAICKAEIYNADLNPFTNRRIRSCGLKQSWVAYRDNARNLASYALTDILTFSRLKNSSLFLSLKVRGIYFSINKLENEA